MISAWCNFTGDNFEFLGEIGGSLHSSEIEGDSCRAGVDSLAGGWCRVAEDGYEKVKIY